MVVSLNIMAHDSLKTWNAKRLLQLTGEVIDELRLRGIARTGNNPLADYTEWLIAKTLHLELADASVQGYDATNKRTNIRYEIKGRRITPRNKSLQVSAIRNIDGRHFDFLIAVIYDQHFDILRAFEIPYEVVRRLGRHSDHTNSLILYARDTLLGQDGVKDITESIKRGQKGVAR